MKTTVSSKGQIVLPAELRREDDVRAGDQFEVERIEDGVFVLRRVTARANKGLIDLLRSCPVSDWYVPLDRNATTDDIPITDLG